jgi:hypothetical protein
VQSRKCILAIDRIAGNDPLQIVQQLLQPRLLALQPLEVLHAVARFYLQIGQHLGALQPRLLERGELRAAFVFELLQMRLRGG